MTTEEHPGVSPEVRRDLPEVRRGVLVVRCNTVDLRHSIHIESGNPMHHANHTNRVYVSVC
jgi:hypothetical protein